MGEVAVIIHGRSYPISCEDGQEGHVRSLASDVESHVSDLVQELGGIGESRLLVMAALLVADDAHDLRDEVEELKGELAQARADLETAQSTAAAVPAPSDAEIEAMVEERVAERLAGIDREVASRVADAEAMAEQRVTHAEASRADIEQRMAGIEAEATAAMEAELDRRLAVELTSIAERVEELVARVPDA